MGTKNQIYVNKNVFMTEKKKIVYYNLILRDWVNNYIYTLYNVSRCDFPVLIYLLILIEIFFSLFTRIKYEDGYISQQIKLEFSIIKYNKK